MEYQSLFEDISLVLLYGGVTMLNLVAGLYLLLRRGNAISPQVTPPTRLRIWAAAFLFVATLSHVSWAYYTYHYSPEAYLILSGLDVLLIIPTIAGFLLSMLQDRRRSVWPVVAMLAPVAVLLALSLSREDNMLITWLSTYVIALFVLFMLYMFFAVRRYGRWLKDNYADLENKEIWQSLLFLAVFLLFFMLYSGTTDNPVLVYLLQIDNLVIVGLVLWRVETLQQLEENVQATADPAASAAPTIPANFGPLLEKHCVQDQLFLQHDLTLSQLAQVIGTNRSYLSQYFAQKGLTYNAYINGLRIDHFIRLYHEAVASQRIFTAQQLAFESGFHSYSTFSSAFKQKMGKPVTEWMRS